MPIDVRKGAAVRGAGPEWRQHRASVCLGTPVDIQGHQRGDIRWGIMLW